MKWNSPFLLIYTVWLIKCGILFEWKKIADIVDLYSMINKKVKINLFYGSFSWIEYDVIHVQECRWVHAYYGKYVNH